MKKFVDRRWPSVRVVALGGGTGLSAVLRGLKEHIAERGKRRPKQSIADLTAVVAAHGRAQNLESAQHAAAQDQSREQLRRFIAAGQGYQPTTVQMFH